MSSVRFRPAPPRPTENRLRRNQRASLAALMPFGVGCRLYRHRKEMHCCLFDPYPGRETANAREFWFFFDLTDQNRSTSRKVWIIRSSPPKILPFKRGRG